MMKGVIKPKAFGIIKNQDRLLVFRGYDSKKGEVFYRLLGGGIEFGETGEQALRREFQEELATDLENVKYLTITENIFTYEGEAGHEIVLVFTADLANKDLYQKGSMSILDSKEKHTVSWQKIDDFKSGRLILYPEGITKYL
jgi:ADP-ribose pyrophosphatase YjhB (NUDIX family)